MTDRSRDHIHQPSTMGQRAADWIAIQVGSWRFIIGFLSVVVLWVVLNGAAFLVRFDPFPFILLNLFLSLLAGIQAPVIMMSQNRQAERDRKRDDTEAQEVEEMTQLTHSIHELTTRIDQMQEVQLAILRRLDPTRLD